MGVGTGGGGRIGGMADMNGEDERKSRTLAALLTFETSLCLFSESQAQKTCLFSES